MPKKTSVRSIIYGGSPGLVVMEGDSKSEGRGFESRHCILDGHFLTYICCQNCNDVCLKRPKINDKRGRGWPIFMIDNFNTLVQNLGSCKLDKTNVEIS